MTTIPGPSSAPIIPAQPTPANSDNPTPLTSISSLEATSTRTIPPRPSVTSYGPIKDERTTTLTTKKRLCPLCAMPQKAGEYEVHVKQDHSKQCMFCSLRFTFDHGLEDHVAKDHQVHLGLMIRWRFVYIFFLLQTLMLDWLTRLGEIKTRT